ncbi:hypothetical protein LZ31DRAFT_117010 [Colletotrichum somersetense]|nr:hypothetical protein LZ31DRAFT_117010 [Colletotrichum somersetense]
MIRGQGWLRTDFWKSLGGLRAGQEIHNGSLDRVGKERWGWMMETRAIRRAVGRGPWNMACGSRKCDVSGWTPACVSKRVMYKCVSPGWFISDWRHNEVPIMGKTKRVLMLVSRRRYLEAFPIHPCPRQTVRGGSLRSTAMSLARHAVVQRRGGRVP